MPAIGKGWSTQGISPAQDNTREKMGCRAPTVHGRQGQKASRVQGIRFQFRLDTELMSQDRERRPQDKPDEDPVRDLE